MVKRTIAILSFVLSIFSLSSAVFRPLSDYVLGKSYGGFLFAFAIPIMILYFLAILAGPTGIILGLVALRQNPRDKRLAVFAIILGSFSLLWFILRNYITIP